MAKDSAFSRHLGYPCLGYQCARRELRRQLQRYLLHAFRRNGRVACGEHAEERFEEAAGSDQLASDCLWPGYALVTLSVKVFHEVRGTH
jgi:hypothetical protein